MVGWLIWLGGWFVLHLFVTCFINCLPVLLWMQGFMEKNNYFSGIKHVTFFFFLQYDHVTNYFTFDVTVVIFTDNVIFYLEMTFKLAINLQ